MGVLFKFSSVIDHQPMDLFYDQYKRLENMLKEDFETIAALGNALWVDRNYSQRSTLETISAVFLMDLTSDRILEKTSQVLLDRARSKSAVTNVGGLGQSFFRLNPDERFLLTALHRGHWSYARLGRILSRTSEEIQEQAWSARIQLGMPSAYPAGPASVLPSCPEYDYRRPWTQRFLDDEVVSGRDRFFLQNHLMVCQGCSKSLSRCREVYFKVDQEIKKVTQNSDFAESLESILSQAPYRKYPSERNFLETLSIFVKRREIKWVVFLAGGAFILRLLLPLF
jgi:hypothetical protein